MLPELQIRKFVICGILASTMATDEAAAMAELVQEASLANVTLQVLLAVKRPREDPEPTESEPTEPAESEAELV